MISIFEKFPWMKTGLVAFAIFFSLILLDSIWHPFPLEYHFGWWFLWFQICLYMTYEMKYHIAIACWIYLIFITLRGLPWGNNWKKTWKPFWGALLGEERVEHWEKWSYRSMYSIEMLVDNFEIPQEVETLKMPEVKQIVPAVIPQPISVPVVEDDAGSTISDRSFIVDDKQLEALAQELKETKEGAMPEENRVNN